jgi:hypothetical protein
VIGQDAGMASQPERLSTSRQLSIGIDCPADTAYEYARDPANLPEWAAGLAGSIELVDGRWVADTAAGRISVAFAEANPYGVLDHQVTLPSGQTLQIPMRVLPDGNGCEVVFTLRRQPGMTEADFDRDADAVTADLVSLKRVLEQRRPAR